MSYLHCTQVLNEDSLNSVNYECNDDRRTEQIETSTIRDSSVKTLHRYLDIQVSSINVGYFAARHTYKAEIFATSADGVRSDIESASFDTSKYCFKSRMIVEKLIIAFMVYDFVAGTAAQIGALGESTTSVSAVEIRDLPSAAPTASKSTDTPVIPEPSPQDNPGVLNSEMLLAIRNARL
ncbi:unnamed protein product [Clavelina lepadiformis]|uniref:Uncharacterized protein n=1 Tax=Clavelina lepadiformis TaxID=159417 RepID=A0ABP0FCN1_CLALP